MERGGEPPRLGRRVAIYGGGNTAMDAARTARRLGAEPLIIYRRTRGEMPAHAFEADEADRRRREDSLAPDDQGNRRLDAPGRSHASRRAPSPQPTGEFETLQADSLILALGQDTDTAFLKNVPGLAFKKDGTVVVGPDMQTGCTGVFAGGDMVPYARTVTTAIGHGKRAARPSTRSCAAPRGRRPADTRSRPSPCSASGITPRQRDVARARSTSRFVNETFDEVVGGLDADGARYESQRCLSCGNCFECDGCYSACPEQAVRKLGPGLRYEYDLDKCTGCAICYDQCPCGAITMVPEPKATRHRKDP